MTLRDVGSWFVEIIEAVKSDLAMIRDASIIDWPLYILIPVVIVALFALVAAIHMATDFARKHYDFTGKVPKTQVGLQGARSFLILVWLLRTLLLWALISFVLSIPVVLWIREATDREAIIMMSAVLVVSLLIALLVPRFWRRR